MTSTILDRDGNPAEGAQGSESKSIAANGEYEFVQQIRVVQPNLWSTESPYLYKVRTSVMDQGSDSYDTAFGIRRTEFDVDRGFLLNGKQVRLNDVCITTAVRSGRRRPRRLFRTGPGECWGRLAPAQQSGD